MKPAVFTKRFAVFFLLSLAALTVILVLTVNQNTVDALRRTQHVVLLYLLGLSAADLLLDGFRNFFLVRGVKGLIPLWVSIRLSAMSIFMNLVTPFSVGGHPTLIYALNRNGVRVGKGTSVVITKLVTMAFFVIGGAVLSLLFYGDRITGIPALQTVFTLSGILFTILLAAGLSGILFPRLAPSVLVALGKPLHALRIIRNTETFKNKMIKQALLARRSLQGYFGKGIVYLILGTFCSGGMYLVETSMLGVILRGLGVDIGFAEGYALSALLLFLISFMPTPGSSGLGEAVFVILFSGSVPKYLLGVTVLLWRIFYQYLPASFGAFVFVRFFSRLLVRKPDGLPVRF
ncbi:flippase-like domain-containing protein [bacterium]|nr:flippase-like domain-containing protein [bacterium]